MPAACCSGSWTSVTGSLQTSPSASTGQPVPAAPPHRRLLPVLAVAPPPPGHGIGHGPGQHLTPQTLEDRRSHPGNRPPHLGPYGFGLSLPGPPGRAVAKPASKPWLISLPPFVLLDLGGEVRPKSASVHLRKGYRPEISHRGFFHLLSAQLDDFSASKNAREGAFPSFMN